MGYPANLAKSSEMNTLNARNFEEEKEEDSAAGRVSIISTNNLQDMESALMVEDGSISGQQNSTDLYKALNEECHSQSYKVHSNNSPDDDNSSGSPSKSKHLGNRLKWTLVKESKDSEAASGNKRSTLSKFLEDLRHGK